MTASNARNHEVLILASIGAPCERTTASGVVGVEVIRADRSSTRRRDGVVGAVTRLRRDNPASCMLVPPATFGGCKGGGERRAC
jgi:hypothetical protein